MKPNKINVLILMAIILILCVQSATSRGIKTAETIKIVAKHVLMFESTKFFDYSYFRFNVEKYKADGMILDSFDGQFGFDNDWWNEGELECGEIIMPNYLEYVFKTTKSIEIEYLVENPNKSKQRNLSEEEMRSIEKKLSLMTRLS